MPVFNYYFGILKWSRKCLNALDSRTRKIMRKYQCHQYGSAVERLYMPRNEGGRGLQRVIDVWEQSIVSMACYLITSTDLNLQGITREQQRGRKRGGTHKIIRAARNILVRHDLQYILEPGAARDPEAGMVLFRKVTKDLKKKQLEKLLMNLAKKTPHGIYYRQCKSDKWDTEGSIKWLVEGRLQGTTESLVIAAHDGVIMTCDYQKRISRSLSSSRVGAAESKRKL